MKRRMGLVLLVVFLVALRVWAQDVPQAALVSRDSTQITLFKENVQIQERRTFELVEGLNWLTFDDVSPNIIRSSMAFRAVTNPQDVSILEQTFTGTTDLLDRYLDKVITVSGSQENFSFSYTGTLISVGLDSVTLMTEDRRAITVERRFIYTVVAPAEAAWLVQSASAGTVQVEFTYAIYSAALLWRVDYAVWVAPDNQMLSLDGAVTLTNTTGVTFENAQVRLASGDVGTLPPAGQREFFDSQIHEIPRPVTLGLYETKQYQFLHLTDIPSQVIFEYNASPEVAGPADVFSGRYDGETGITHLETWLRFTVDETNGLRNGLSNGFLQVYGEEDGGGLLSLGSYDMPAKPAGDALRFSIGRLFNMRGERNQTVFTVDVTADETSEWWMEETTEIRLVNDRDETITVRVKENMFRSPEWEIISSSHTYQRVNSRAIDFLVDVPAGGETIITYTVRYSWPLPGAAFRYDYGPEDYAGNLGMG